MRIGITKLINKRIAGVKVVPHHAMIQEFDDKFYTSFHCIVSGLDSIKARRWLNQKLLELAALKDGSDTEWDPMTCIPCINGGTEGFKGETRVIQAHQTPCFECLVELFPKDPFNFPMCTVAHTPRQPEHCIVYAMEQSWPDAFGKEKKWDGDNADDINWIMAAAETHAQKFGITGVTFKLTQGVVKRIIPAIASTNAVISACCANEVFKMVTNCHGRLNNFLNYSGDGGCNTNVIPNELNAACLVCGSSTITVHFERDATFQDFVNFIKEDQEKFSIITDPVMTWEDDTDKDCSFIYCSAKGFASFVEANLVKTLSELFGPDGGEFLLGTKGVHKFNRINLQWTEKQNK